MPKRLFLVVLLLLLHFGLRAHNILVQRPYVDEGYHAKHATEAWAFARHPAAYAHGKLLLYYWLGLFEGVGRAYLYSARASVALVSTVTAAAVYLLGRLLRDHKTGVLAVGLYAVFPFSLFFERMAMSDAFAAVFVGLVAWWSLAFVRRPTLWRGAVLGAFLALAVLSKLSVGAIVVLPVAAAALYGQFVRVSFQRSQAFLKAKAVVRRLYLPGLAAAACVLGLLLLPLLVPVFLSRFTASPLPLVVSYTYDTEKNIFEYIRQVWPLLEDFITLPLPLAAVGGALVLLVGRAGAETRRSLWFLWVWAAALAAPPILAAGIGASRYFVPAAVPFVVLVAYLAVAMPARWLRVAAMFGIGVWVGGFALPFVHTALNAPDALSFRGQNFNEYQSGILASEPGGREAAAYLNASDEPVEAVFITWRICYSMYFYLERDVTCLEERRPLGSLWEHLASEVERGEAAYVVISDYREPFFQRIPGLGWEHVAMYPRTTPSGRRQVDIWRVFWHERTAP